MKNFPKHGNVSMETVKINHSNPGEACIWRECVPELSISVYSQSLSRVRLFATPWMAAPQVPLSMDFPRLEYWSELPFPIVATLPDPGIEPVSSAPPALAGRLLTPRATWEAHTAVARDVEPLSRVRLLATPWTAAYHAPPSTGFSRQKYWSGLPFTFPEDLPNPGNEPGSPAL